MPSCPALFISAPASGQGKTTITAGLARYHRRQGRRVRVFKTGPDFLDPMILARASGAPVLSLDLWMVGEDGLPRTARASGSRGGSDPDRRRDGAVRRHAEQRRSRHRVRRAGGRGDFRQGDGADLRRGRVRPRAIPAGGAVLRRVRQSRRLGASRADARRGVAAGPALDAGISPAPTKSNCPSAISACIRPAKSTIWTHGSIAPPMRSRKPRWPSCRRRCEFRAPRARQRCRACWTASTLRLPAMPRSRSSIRPTSRCSKHWARRSATFRRLPTSPCPKHADAALSAWRLSRTACSGRSSRNARSAADDSRARGGGKTHRRRMRRHALPARPTHRHPRRHHANARPAARPCDDADRASPRSACNRSTACTGHDRSYVSLLEVDDAAHAGCVRPPGRKPMRPARPYSVPARSSQPICTPIGLPTRPSRPPCSMAKRFNDSDREAVYRAIYERRDMRHFVRDPVDPAVLQRLLDAAHHAPSVGFMQPWRIARITDPALRAALHETRGKRAARDRRRARQTARRVHEAEGRRDAGVRRTAGDGA